MNTEVMDFPGHFEQIFQQLNHQRLHGQLCDCVIVVSGRHFKAHRAVLAACSTHFRALFSVSEDDGSISVIRLDSEVVTAEAFSVLMDMMYTSTLTLGDSSVMDVLLAASHLHLISVVKACKQFLTARTLPKSPSQHVEQQNLSSSSKSRLQRSFLLQQLGLSIVSSALSEETEEDAGRTGQGVGPVSGSGIVEPRDVYYPPRRLHRRKQGYSSIRSESRQRSRLLSQAHGIVTAAEPGTASERLLSPDSHSRMLDEDSKPDVMLITGEEAAVQEDVQLPSQSDSGRASKMEPLLLPHKLEYSGADGEQLKDGGADGEVRHIPVVVKNEPYSSPEPADEISDVTSQAEGSDQVEPVGEKLELSPEGSEHSFSEPQPSSDLLLSEIKESAEDVERADADDGGGGARSNGRSGYLTVTGFDPSTTAAECALDREPPRFLFGSDSASLLLPPSQSLLTADMQEFSGMRADAFLMRPFHDGLATSSTEHLTADYQRNNVGVHFGRAATNGVGFPSYRRIAPKIAPGTSSTQDAASTSSSLHSSGPSFNHFSQAGAHSGSNPRPQLTRASADVLSKCKKALSEHNVLVVEGARKYACKICCKTFLTLTDCKKHIRVHTGEKPYACLKCGKRFSQSSHLYKHSKTTCLRWQNTPVSNALL